MLTAERLREILAYEPATGTFTWLRKSAPRANRRPIGSKAGDLKASGYVAIGVDGSRYLAHRLAWLYMTGEWPTRQIDHANGVRSDNRWVNLRQASPAENAFNRDAQSNNKIGLKGVHALPSGRWRARICRGGEVTDLGVFPSPETAHAAYCDAEARLFGAFVRARP